jgi:hypothetical protein
MIKFPMLLDAYDIEPSPDGDLIDRDQVIQCLKDMLKSKSDPKLVVSHLGAWLSFLTSDE